MLPALFCCLFLFLAIFILSKEPLPPFGFSFSLRIISFILLAISSWESLALLLAFRSTLVILFPFGYPLPRNFEDFF